MGEDFGVEFVGGFDVESGAAVGFGKFDEFAGVGGVATSDDDDGFGALLDEVFEAGLAFFGGAANGVEDLGFGVEFEEAVVEFLVFVGKHGGLGYHADAVIEFGKAIEVVEVLDDVAFAVGIAE